METELSHSDKEAAPWREPQGLFKLRNTFSPERAEASQLVGKSSAKRGQHTALRPLPTLTDELLCSQRFQG